MLVASAHQGGEEKQGFSSLQYVSWCLGSSFNICRHIFHLLAALGREGKRSETGNGGRKKKKKKKKKKKESGSSNSQISAHASTVWPLSRWSCFRDSRNLGVILQNSGGFTAVRSEREALRASSTFELWESLKASLVPLLNVEGVGRLGFGVLYLALDDGLQRPVDSAER